MYQAAKIKLKETHYLLADKSKHYWKCSEEFLKYFHKNKKLKKITEYLGYSATFQ